DADGGDASVGASDGGPGQDRASRDTSQPVPNAEGGPSEGGDSGCAQTMCGVTCTDTASDPKHCGACNHDCAALMNVGKADGITRVSGKCVIPATSCSTGLAHCGANPDDGCETDIGTSAHCGSCGKSWSAGAAVCAGGEWVKACPAATPTLCGSTC